MPGNGTASWRVDGNIASINAASADFIKYRCPKSTSTHVTSLSSRSRSLSFVPGIKITTRVTINCADDLNHAAAVMRDNLVVLLRAATKKFGVAETLVDVRSLLPSQSS